MNTERSNHSIPAPPQAGSPLIRKIPSRPVPARLPVPPSNFSW
jgi:hypothetical protein